MSVKLSHNKNLFFIHLTKKISLNIRKIVTEDSMAMLLSSEQLLRAVQYYIIIMHARYCSTTSLH